MSSPAPALAHTLPPGDVTLHLRPARPRLVGVEEKEALIRAGVSYGELLTPERVPGPEQRAAYAGALARSGERVGRLLAALAGYVLRAERPVLVSLARAGTPVGCALRRLARAWGHDLPHHSLSIIRGLGIDRVALAQVERAHPGASLFFVDGWTGKGSVAQTLRASLPPGVAPRLVVLSDPAGCAEFAGTYDDLLLPHAALNATVCGLLSRSFYTDPGELHAARIEEALRPEDQTGEYLNALERLSAPFGPQTPPEPGERPLDAPAQTSALAQGLDFGWGPGVADPHRLKPSVGEATRVFLRRRPGGLLLRELGDPETAHLLALARGAGVPVFELPGLPYRAAAVIHPGGPS